MQNGVAKMSNGEVDAEIVLPGVVGGPGAPTGTGASLRASEATQRASDSAEPEVESDVDDELEDVEESVTERLLGLMEMMPDKFWVVLGRSVKWGYWFVRRSGWVLGTSLALLVLPPLLEQQRVEFQEMQNMQKKQMLLGPGHSMSPPLQGPR